MTGSEVSCLHLSTKFFKRPAIKVFGMVSLTLLFTISVVGGFTASWLPLSFSLRCEIENFLVFDKDDFV